MDKIITVFLVVFMACIVIWALTIITGCTVNFQTISAHPGAGDDETESKTPTVNTRINVPLTGE